MEFCRNESRARFARDSEKRRTENKWNCIHGASEGLLRKMNHKWSGKLARTCNRSKEPPDSIASPDRLTMEFLYGRCVLPFCSYRALSLLPIVFLIFYFSRDFLSCTFYNLGKNSDVEIIIEVCVLRNARTRRKIYSKILIKQDIDRYKIFFLSYNILINI